MISVTELQRKRIVALEREYKKLAELHGNLMDVANSLGHALDYLTEDHFRQYLKKVDWNQIISYYCENNENA